MKYLSIDLETCGLDTANDSILEFGAVLDDLSDPKPFEELPRYHCYLLPIDGKYHGQPFALSMHPNIFLRIAKRDEYDSFNYVSPLKLGYKFKQFLLDNCFEERRGRITINVAGKNFAAFDLQVLNHQTDFSKHVKIRHKILDPGPMYVTKEDDVIPGTAECLERAGVYGTEIAHTAIEDSLDVIRLVRYKLLGDTYED